MNQLSRRVHPTHWSIYAQRSAWQGQGSWLDDDDAEAMCDRVYSTTKPWSCTWGDTSDGLSASPMLWGNTNNGVGKAVGDDDSPMGVSFNLQHKINACGC